MQIHSELTNATTMHQAGKLLEAESLYLGYLEKHPGDSIALYMVGMLQGQMAKIDIAADYFQQSIKSDSGFIESHLGLGNALFQLGKYKEALSTYRDALKLSKNSFPALFGVGKCLRVLGQLAESANSFRKALKIQHNNAECMFNLAEVLMLQGNLEKAVYTLKRTETLRPDKPEIQCRLGDAYQQQGRHKEAEKYFRRAIELDPRHVEAYWRLGDLLRERGEQQVAKDLYRKAVEISPNNVFAQTRYGHSLLTTGPEEKLDLIRQVQTDHYFDSADEAADIARRIAEVYGFHESKIADALVTFFDEFDPAQIYPDSWWREQLSKLGSPESGNDRLVRGIFSQVFSWSIPTTECHREIADYIGSARLKSLGAGNGYWEYLLNTHYGINVEASDIRLVHRFIKVEKADYITAAIEQNDVIMIAWVPVGESSATKILQRMFSEQKLVLIGEMPESAGLAQSCGTSDFYAYLIKNFINLKTFPLTRFNYFRDSASFLEKK